MSSSAESDGARDRRPMTDPAVNSNKKRKVQRACDLCRRKKVRCDAAQSSTDRCSNCAAAGTNCTFVSEAKKRGPPKGYVESLEKKLEKMEDLLQKLAPGVDIEAELTAQAADSSASSPAADDKDKFQRHTRHEHSPRTLDLANPTLPYTHSEVTLLKDYASNNFKACKPITDYDNIEYESSDDEFGPEQVPDIITDAMQDLSLGDPALSRFHGKSSSLTLVRAASDLRKQHGYDAVGTRRAEFWTPGDWEWELMDDTSPPNTITFPPEDLAATLIELFFRHFSPFFPIVHRPSFEAQYKDRLHLRNTSSAMVVLLVCAIASRYCDDPRVCLKNGGRPSAGWKYFVQVKDLKRSLHAPAKLSDLQTYALVAYYLQATSAPHSAWTVIGIGIRCAQDIGVHRKKIYRGTISLHEEQWKRVFWCLVALDRSLSSALGRPLACQDEDFDLDFPEEIDDEYWMPPAADNGGVAPPMPKQPDGVPSKISFFVAYLKLGQILAFALRTIYTINKSKVLLGFVGEQWEQHIVAELDSAMNKWLDAVPDHLRWDPNREDQMHFEQSAVLYSAYYHLHIMIHRPFIPSPRKPALLSFPSLTICTNAARSCSHVIHAYGKRSERVTPSVIVAAFTSGVVLLIAIWGAKKTGLSVDYHVHMSDVDKCLEFLQKSERDWHYSGRLADILRELASFGEMPIRNIQSAPVSNKRDRDETQDSTPSSACPEARFQEDDVSRLFKPIPRARQNSPPRVGSSSNVPVSSMPLPPQNYPMPPGMVPTSGVSGSQGSQFFGSMGGVVIPPPIGTVKHHPSGTQDNTNPSAAIADYFDTTFLRNLPLGSNVGAPSTSTQPPDPQVPQQHPWEGILSQQQQNPYGTNVAAPGVLTPDYFNPYLGYQGAGGPLGFAVEAQAFLGSDDPTNWQDPLSVGAWADWNPGASIPGPAPPTTHPQPGAQASSHGTHPVHQGSWSF